jgi:hypothetical protein
MKHKNTIGVNPTKEISEAKSKLHKDWYISNVEFRFPKSIHVYYFDNNNVRQLRTEVWEEVDSNTARIALMNYIKNNTLEGEQISVLWD